MTEAKKVFQAECDRIDGLDKQLDRTICECRSEAFKHLEMVDLTLKKIRNGNNVNDGENE